MNNSNEPAMPQERIEAHDLNGVVRPETVTYPCPTKREYFAGLAMQAFISTGDYAAAQGTAKEAVQAADCLLYELENTK